MEQLLHHSPLIKITDTIKYVYYKVPCLLLTKEPYKSGLTVDAKLLYGLMLDRTSLSVKNNMIDEKGRPYIYFSTKSIMSMLSCQTGKVHKCLKALEDYNLIERTVCGFPARTAYYVKNYMTLANTIAENEYISYDEAALFSTYRIPKLLYDERYADVITNRARLLYAILLDILLNASAQTERVNSNGELYVCPGQQRLIELMGYDRKTVRETLNQLEQAHLITIETLYNCKNDRIYLTDIYNEVSKDTVGKNRNTGWGKIATLDGEKSQRWMGKNRNAGGEKIATLDGKKSQHWMGKNRAPNNNQFNNIQLNISSSRDDDIATKQATEYQKPNIDYDTITIKYGDQAAQAIESVMAEVYSTSDEQIVNVGGSKIKAAQLKAKFALIQTENICAIYERISRSPSTSITSVYAYILTALYRSATYGEPIMMSKNPTNNRALDYAQRTYTSEELDSIGVNLLEI